MKMWVTARSGNQFEVDISDSACLRLGPFKHGDIISHEDGWNAKVLGVARNEEWVGHGDNVLWMAEEKGGRAFYYHPKDLRDFSKRRLPEIRKPLNVPKGHSVQAVSVVTAIVTTFKPLKGGRVRCNQTGKLMKAKKTDSYRRQRAAGAI
jgi:hypothetical protein